MESLTTEQEIEQQLTKELSRLKKAVTYIEEAKETASSSAKLLTEMNVKLNEMQEAKTDIQASFVITETKILENIASNKKLSDEALQGIQSEIKKLRTSYDAELLKLRESNKKLSEETQQGIHIKIQQLDASYKEELLKLRDSNKMLKVVSYFSFGASTLILLSLIAIVIAAINDL